MKFRIIFLAILPALVVMSVFYNIVNAQMSSTNYEIRFDSLNFGSSDSSSSASYGLRSNIGVGLSDRSSSSSYILSSGYREGIYDPVADFDIFVQSMDTQTGAISLSSNTVTIADPSGYAVGEMIVVIQDEGASQYAAFGKISSISGSDLIVDFWTNSGSAPVIDGTNDYVYELTSTTISLGALVDSVVTTSIVAWEVNFDADDGYSVYVSEDTNLQDASATYSISDVSDGSVTAGSSEYGAISSDSSLSLSTFDTQDTAFTTSLQQVGSRSDNAMISRDFLTIKTAISSSQNVATYYHSLTFVYVGDY